ncbi:tryptophan 7-halogenase [Streptomyces sp. NA02950]|uniref:NAD(P)/FAD-dependent oxidoreductase n=1 Tax=Streptomyces sp. NA02950 TaxID=2742137 RepID=UPI001590E697|nr:tryptophan 7-halogenase [Streptomyces sp. NA02950]QKV97014.1 tryptophan 7-halogenase [Streptomyces sp. NA02950]
MTDQHTQAMTTEPDILIMGGGVTANLLAAYFRKYVPDLSVVIVRPRDSTRPIVGESTIEITTRVMQDLGLSRMLVEKHFPKYGLTYYYKRNLKDPTDPVYYTSEPANIPPFPAFQLNRFVFDRDLEQINIEGGVRVTNGRVREVSVGEGAARHRTKVQLDEGDEIELSSRWLVDATGRSRVLGRALHLHTPDEHGQRDVFWMRVSNFDEGLLRDIPSVKKENRSFDSYYATHHFMGKGNWIWAIPMRTDEHENLISIGIIYRPDIYPHTIRNAEDFDKYVAEEHPAVADLVRSGTVEDTNRYRKYMYTSRQRYSANGWFCIGDAADSVDPLYSTGLALSSVQATQITELITRQRNGTCGPDFASDLDRAFEVFHHTAQNDITRLYEVMDQPLTCALWQHLGFITHHYVVAPFVLSGYLCDPVGAKLWSRLVGAELAGRGLNPMKRLVQQAAARDGLDLRSELPRLQSGFALNFRFFEWAREEDMARSLARMHRYLVGFRLRMMRHAGWSNLSMDQLGELARDAAAGSLLPLLFEGRKVRSSQLVARWLGVRGPVEHTTRRV